MLQPSFVVSELIRQSSFISESTDQSIFYGHKERMSDGTFMSYPPFFISYQTSTIICLTRESKYTRDLIRIKDSITLDITLLDPFKTTVEIFVHYPGQLIRSLDSPSWTHSNFNSYQGHTFIFRLSQGTLIRKRETRHSPCDNRIEDYDTYFQEIVVNETGCIYPFWKTIAKGFRALRNALRLKI